MYPASVCTIAYIYFTHCNALAFQRRTDACTSYENEARQQQKCIWFFVIYFYFSEWRKMSVVLASSYFNDKRGLRSRGKLHAFKQTTSPCYFAHIIYVLLFIATVERAFERPTSTMKTRELHSAQQIIERHKGNEFKDWEKEAEGAREDKKTTELWANSHESWIYQRFKSQI